MESSTVTRPVAQASAAPPRAASQLPTGWLLREPVLLRIALFLTIACYLPTLGFDFVYDDHFLLATNPWMESWSKVPDIFRHSFWGFLQIPRLTDYYRPMVMLLLASVRHILGPAPGWSHLVVAGVHVLATYLVYRLAKELVKDGVTAAVAAAIFGLHPTKVESAAWISGISDSLCVVFFLASLIGYFRWKNAGKQGRLLWLSLGLLLLALFSKEAAVLAPVLIAIYELSTAEGGRWQRATIALRTVTPFVAVVAFFWIVRMLALRGFVGPSEYELQLGPTLWTAPRAALWYVGKQVWPGTLSVQYPLVLVRSFSWMRFVLPLILVTASAAAVLYAVRRRPAGIFLASWFALTLAPVILFCIPLQAHDRYGYLPSVATSIAIAYVLVQFKSGSPSLGRARGIIVYAVILALAAATLNYERYWDNDLRLFERAVAVAPDNPDAYSGLVLAHDLNADFAGAESVARKWVERMPERWVSWYGLAMARANQKDYEGARVALQSALQHTNTQKGAVVPLVALGDVSSSLRRDAEAEICFRQAVAIAPNVASLHGFLAAALKRNGKLAEAQHELEVKKSLE